MSRTTLLLPPHYHMPKDLPKRKNGKKTIELAWNGETNAAFMKLKIAVMKIVSLQVADRDKDFVLTLDANNRAMGAALRKMSPMASLALLSFSLINSLGAKQMGVS